MEDVMASQRAATLDASGVISFDDVEHFLTELDLNLSRGRIFVRAEESYPPNARLRVSLEPPGIACLVGLEAVVVFARNNHYGLQLENIEAQRGVLDTLKWGVEQAIQRSHKVPVSEAQKEMSSPNYDETPMVDISGYHADYDDYQESEDLEVLVEEALLGESSPLSEPDTTTRLSIASVVAGRRSTSASPINIEELILSGSPSSSPESPLLDPANTSPPPLNESKTDSDNAPRYAWVGASDPTEVEILEEPDGVTYEASAILESELLISQAQPESVEDPLPAWLGPPELDPLFSDDADKMAFETRPPLPNKLPPPLPINPRPSSGHYPTLPGLPARLALPGRLALPPPTNDEDLSKSELAAEAGLRTPSENEAEVFNSDMLRELSQKLNLETSASRKLAKSSTSQEPSEHKVDAHGLAALEGLNLPRATADGTLSLHDPQVLLGLWLTGMRNGVLTILGGPPGLPEENITLKLTLEKELVVKARILARAGPWLTVRMNDIEPVRRFLAGVLATHLPLAEEEMEETKSCPIQGPTTRPNTDLEEAPREESHS